MRTMFEELAAELIAELNGSEVLLLNFAGENSDFVRWNHGRVRQATNVVQRTLSLELIVGSRHAHSWFVVSGRHAADLERGRAALRDLRSAVEDSPDDPHLLYATDVQNSERCEPNQLQPTEDVLDAIAQSADGVDLVGIYASGGVCRGFANSLGQRNWFEGYNLNFDWSLYHVEDRAVKCAYAGSNWSSQEYEAKMRAAREQVERLKTEPRTIAPGRYRAYLTPAALSEVLDVVAWGGFGLRDHKTKKSTLLQLATGEKSLDERISLVEDTAHGFGADFQAQGFVKPERVTLIKQGKFANCLASPRSAREFDSATNGASSSEFPEAASLEGGSLANHRVLAELGTGVYVSNLWYINYSDRNACRMTGMTRFATFWVENGELIAPLKVMRFDETIYNLLGSHLVDLTQECEVILDPGTYGGRSTASVRLPGALVDEFLFTL